MDTGRFYITFELSNIDHSQRRYQKDWNYFKFIFKFNLLCWACFTYYWPCDQTGSQKFSPFLEWQMKIEMSCVKPGFSTFDVYRQTPTVFKQFKPLREKYEKIWAVLAILVLDLNIIRKDWLTCLLSLYIKYVSYLSTFWTFVKWECTDIVQLRTWCKFDRNISILQVWIKSNNSFESYWKHQPTSPMGGGQRRIEFIESSQRIHIVVQLV